MKKNKTVFIGILLILLFGIGLLIGGFILAGNKAELETTTAKVISVHSRAGDDGIEYRSEYEYYVEGKRYIYYGSWSSFRDQVGETCTIEYDKNNPEKVGNPKNVAIFLFIIGGVLAGAGVVLTVKVLYDNAKRKRKQV